jgi:KTSC domain
MAIPGQPTVKWVPVDADQFEAIGYVLAGRKLYVKFRSSPALCFEGVPGFRYQGLLAAPRKDAYFKSFIKSSFLAKEVQMAPGA